MTEAGPVVSVLTPASAYFHDLPRAMRCRTGARRAAVLYGRRGTFGTRIRQGVGAGARAAGFDVVRAIPFETPLHDAPRLLDKALDDHPDLLVAAGRAPGTRRPR